MARYAYERLTALDNSFLLFEDGRSHMHVASTAIFDAGPLATREGGVDIERIRAYIESRLHRIPRYRQRLSAIPIEGRPVWVDDERFNLFYHVRHTSLPRPGDERQLKRLSGRIASQQLDRGKPLWELWIVEGLQGNRFAMITKVHHCMIDGISGVDLLEVLMDVSPETTWEDSHAFVPRGTPGTYELLRDEVVDRLSAPLRLTMRALREPWSFVKQASDGAAALVETLSAGARMPSETPLNQPIGPYRRFDWLAMEIADLKAVKNVLGGSLNDVVLATVAGAVRRFLTRRRVNVGSLDFRVMVPVSLRTREEHGTLGNRVAAWFAALPIGEADPEACYRAVRATTQELKQSKQAMGAEILSQVTEWTPSTLMALGVRLAHNALPFNLVVTNVPGPQVPLYLLGAPMREAYPLVPLFANLSLGIALFSYCGSIYWGFNADWDNVPDLHEFVSDIEDAFADLRAAAGLPRERPKERAATAS